MRRFLLPVLILALFCCSALAEDAEYRPYTHPRMGYTLDVPSAWQIMDQTTADTFLAAYQNGDMPWVDPAPIAEAEKEMADQEAALFFSPDGGILCINKTNLGLSMTSETFMSMMMPTYLEKYEATYEKVSFPGHPSVYYTEDDRGFCYLTVTYVWNEQEITATQYFHMVGEDMYVFHFTHGPLGEEDYLKDILYDYRPVFRHMMDTFTPAAE